MPLLLDAPIALHPSTPAEPRPTARPARSERAQLSTDSPESAPTPHSTTFGRALSATTRPALESPAAEVAPLLGERLAGLIGHRERTPSPEPAAAIGDDADRRRLPRRDGACDASIAVLEGSNDVHADWRFHAADLHGSVVDLSLTSLSVRLPEPVAEGARVRTRVANRAKAVSLEVTGRVLRSIDLRDEGTNVVVELDERLSLDDVATYGRMISAPIV